MTAFPESVPFLVPVDIQQVSLLDGVAFDSRVIDITDVVADPADPLGDFTQPLGVSNTRAWVLAWSVMIDLPTMVGFVGTNRANLILRVFDNPRALLLGTQNSPPTHRLYIPDISNATYVYTGSRIVHSKQAGVQILNRTGDTVDLEVAIWAKGW